MDLSQSRGSLQPGSVPAGEAITDRQSAGPGTNQESVVGIPGNQSKTRHWQCKFKGKGFHNARFRLGSCICHFVKCVTRCLPRPLSRNNKATKNDCIRDRAGPVKIVSDYSNSGRDGSSEIVRDCDNTSIYESSDIVRDYSNTDIQGLSDNVRKDNSRGRDGTSEVVFGFRPRDSQTMHANRGQVLEVDIHPRGHGQCDNMCTCAKCAHPLPTEATECVHTSVKTLSHGDSDDLNMADGGYGVMFGARNQDGTTSVGSKLKMWTGINRDISHKLFTTSDSGLADMLEESPVRSELRLVSHHDLQYTVITNTASHTKVFNTPGAIAVCLTDSRGKLTSSVYDDSEIWGENEQFGYAYQVLTCPGSSGAPVFRLGRNIQSFAQLDAVETNRDISL